MLSIFPAVHSRPTSKDLVLEEVNSEDDQDQDQENRSEHPSKPKQAEPVVQLDPEAMSSSASTSCLKQEDAETQTRQWTPFIESIKREAEDKAMATMEEWLVSHFVFWKFCGYKRFQYCWICFITLQDIYSTYALHGNHSMPGDIFPVIMLCYVSYDTHCTWQSNEYFLYCFSDIYEYSGQLFLQVT